MSYVGLQPTVKQSKDKRSKFQLFISGLVVQTYLLEHQTQFKSKFLYIEPSSKFTAFCSLLPFTHKDTAICTATTIKKQIHQQQKSDKSRTTVRFS